MLAEVSIELEARNPLANRLRQWSVELSHDLFGAWTVDVNFGRIGSRGCRVRYVFSSEMAAKAFVGQGLRRRATAPMRIGAAYHCVHASADAREWLAKTGIVCQQMGRADGIAGKCPAGQSGGA